MSEDMITWSGDEDRQSAFASYSENIDSYGGLGKSSAYHRDFLNIDVITSSDWGRRTPRK